jgi:hypothetical protein|tara:strand:+ start:2463 stop:2729 length:267 start_codon:yes stop_codon:yes gene_type:complete
MEKAFILSFIITCMFVLVKIVDMKYISKEWKPMKTVIRESLLVLVSSTISVVVYFLTNGSMSDFFNVITESKTLKPSATEVFTGEPGF